MADLKVGHNEIENFFQLLGEKEDSISLAIAWALTRSDGLLRRFLKATAGWKGSIEGAQVSVHRYEGDAGITDIEIESLHSCPFSSSTGSVSKRKRGLNNPKFGAARILHP